MSLAKEAAVRSPVLLSEVPHPAEDKSFRQYSRRAESSAKSIASRTPISKAKGTALGAGILGTAGLAAGSLIGGRRGAAIGGALGTLAGARSGYKMHESAKARKQYAQDWLNESPEHREKYRREQWERFNPARKEMKTAGVEFDVVTHHRDGSEKMHSHHTPTILGGKFNSQVLYEHGGPYHVGTSDKKKARHFESMTSQHLYSGDEKDNVRLHTKHDRDKIQHVRDSYARAAAHHSSNSEHASESTRATAKKFTSAVDKALNDKNTTHVEFRWH